MARSSRVMRFPHMLDFMQMIQLRRLLRHLRKGICRTHIMWDCVHAFIPCTGRWPVRSRNLLR
jgi:hypothetical protein